ncbi:RNA exonuclease 4 [Fasciolopsis buskii]|uniref:RNA exonuclease 4 n=1 Tax=Fasciolopsis buskii TaxID=27845 RepID=A0A8E0VPQ6_9TREM|nr:RNA exonuclease 4 [Fasciolopsis buski]
MTFDEQRIVAHTTVMSHASSPCGKYVVFGTNMQRLLVYISASFFQHRQFECRPIKTVHLEISKSWHSLCTSSQFLFCASHDIIWIFRWCCERQSILEKVDHIRLPSEDSGICCSVITNLLYDSLSDGLIVSTGTGMVHVYVVGAQFLHLLQFSAHDSMIHGLCSAGENQFATCSEEGTVRFWETRLLRGGGVNAQAVGTFHPHQVPCLGRPHLGRWLTTVSCDTSDWNWFVTGGGPSLSLWNRRAGRHVTPLHPDASSDTWYAQTSVFSFPSIEPRIVAGGNSGHLYRWDHGGSLVSSLSLVDPPDAQLSHVMVIKPITATGLPELEEEDLHMDALTLMESDDKEDLHSSRSRLPRGVLVIGGAGPAIRVISALGYPLGTLTLY